MPQEEASYQEKFDRGHADHPIETNVGLADGQVP